MAGRRSRLATGMFGEGAWEGAGDGRVADGDRSTMGIDVGEAAEKTPRMSGRGGVGNSS